MSDITSGLDAVSPNCDVDGVSDEGEDVELTVGDEDHSEEGATARGVTVPIKPSQEEVNKHMWTHIPFRSWCPHCVKGKSVNKSHRNAKSCTKSSIPIVSIDYAYMTEEDKHESEDTGTMPIMVIHDSRSKAITADVVTAKGVNDYAVSRVMERLKAFGYTEFIFKSDQ